jgi:hypothetical protein
VIDVTIAARPGQRVGGTGSFLDRVGHVITAAPTAAAARSAAETALSLLQVDVDADDKFPAPPRHPTATPGGMGGVPPTMAATAAKEWA